MHIKIASIDREINRVFHPSGSLSLLRDAPLSSQRVAWKAASSPSNAYLLTHFVRAMIPTFVHSSGVAHQGGLGRVLLGREMILHQFNDLTAHYLWLCRNS